MAESNDYVSCPNSKCKNIGFLSKQECTGYLECNDCQTQWKSEFKKPTVLDYFYNSNTFSNLYMTLYAQPCPNCKVMIIRTEGCKFMKCSRCQYKFCWLCLSEFYTEYHQYQTMCPLRVIPIKLILIILQFFLLAKLHSASVVTAFWV